MNSLFEGFIGSDLHMNLLLLIGLTMFVGTIGARFFQKLKVPQVVGYIFTGLLVGEFGIKMLSAETIENLRPINYFALGIIGFMIGGELSASVFKKYGKQFIAMVLAEGLGAFIAVSISIGVITYLFTYDFIMSVVLGLVIGAISSATDPASTIQVFWEYRTRGALTTAIVAIVALDDALALALYAVATSIANSIAGSESSGMIFVIGHFMYEVLGSLFLGGLVGLLLSWTYKLIDDSDKLLPYTIGLILLVIGISQLLELDIILASMAFGVTFVNMLPRRSHDTFELVKKFAPPIYVLFFVFVGARLNLSHISLLVLLLVGAYLVFRSLGKIIGVYFAAKFSKAAERVQKYAGMCLFTQAGVAVGLSIMASQHFNKEIGDIIVTVITATTFVVQIIGPAFVKLAVKKAGEIDLDIKEEDLIKMYKVDDVMERYPRVIPRGMHVSDIIKMFSEGDESVYYVVDEENNIVGCVTLEGIRATLATGSLNDMLIADDVMDEITKKAVSGDKLSDIIKIMEANHYEFLPVVSAADKNKLVGLIDYKKLKYKLSAEILKRKQLAESA